MHKIVFGLMLLLAGGTAWADTTWADPTIVDTTFNNTPTLDDYQTPLLDPPGDILTNYDISFTLTSGSPLPTSASFTYDSTTPQFSNFQVVWDTATFDLTRAANNPVLEGSVPACVGGATGAAATFAILTTCNGIGDAFWSADASEGIGGFTFASPSLTDCEFSTSCLSASDFITAPFNLDASGLGDFTILVATPEPGTLWLLLGGIGLSVLARRREFKRRPHKASVLSPSYDS